MCRRAMCRCALKQPDTVAISPRQDNKLCAEKDGKASTLNVLWEVGASDTSACVSAPAYACVVGKSLCTHVFSGRLHSQNQLSSCTLAADLPLIVSIFARNASLNGTALGCTTRVRALLIHYLGMAVYIVADSTTWYNV